MTQTQPPATAVTCPLRHRLAGAPQTAAFMVAPFLSPVSHGFDCTDPTHALVR